MDWLMIFLWEIMFPTKVPLEMECYGFTSLSKIPRTLTTLIENCVSTNLPNLRALLEKTQDFGAMI
jgi:hypothetical protein